jgi:invasion protein IalB
VPSADRWPSRCVSLARNAAADCMIEQRLVVEGAGEAFVTVSVRVPAEPRRPLLTITSPLGLYLPAGVTLRIDDGEATRLDLQGCDNNGCYASAPIAPALLASLQTGTVLHLILENMARQTINIDVPLDGFGDGYGKIE